MNVVKTKAMRILRQTFPIKNTIDKKQLSMWIIPNILVV
jgi:hypothetical protein